MISAADVTGRARSAIASAARAAGSRRMVPVWIAAGAIAVLLVTVIALGGLDRGEVVPNPVAVGEEVRMPLYAVTVLDAELADEVEEESLKADPGETLVVVSMRLENLTDRPIGVDRAVDRVESRLINSVDPLLRLSGVASDHSTEVWRDDGSAGTVILQPGVPSQVTMAWIVPEDALARGIISLDVYNAVETRGQVLLSADHVVWLRGELAARITVDAEGTA